MAIDRWFIGGGAEHTPESARRSLYASTSGATGVGSINDLRVRPLAVPGQGVRVAVGSALIKSNYVGGETQTYMGTVYTEESVEITPTGSGSSRTDLIIMRVEDPFAAGSPYDPPSEGDIPHAPYIHIRVVSGVPANTTKVQDVAGYQNDSAETLARITLPASTGTVTTAMITDLREIAQPRRLERVFARPRVTADNSSQNYLTATLASGGEYFPGGAGYANEFQLDVPEWATHMVIDARWMAVNYGNDRRPTGRFWIEYGNEFRNKTWPNNRHWEYQTQEFDFNASRNDAGSNADWSLMDTRSIATKLRGERCTFVFKAGVTNIPGSNHTWMDALSGLGCRVTFSEGLVDPNIL